MMKMFSVLMFRIISTFNVVSLCRLKLFNAMGLLLLLLGVISAVTTAAGIGVQNRANEANVQAQKDTNEANLEAVRETNSANVQQAELAYQRSLPVNQVRDLMTAGMSKAGALNKLAGGGVYSAPALQSASQVAPRFEGLDLSKLGDVAERLGNIPSSVQQHEMVQVQLDAAKADAEYKRAEEMRKAEQHYYQMQRERYDKWERESMDNFMSLMENAAHEKNLQPSANQSLHDYIRALGLQDTEEYKTLPESARQTVFDRYKQIQDEKRAQQDSKDKHDLFKQNLQDLRDAANDYKAAKNAREKEYKLREVRAQVDLILAEENLSLEEFRRSLEFNADGSPKFSRKVSERAKRAWDRVADTVGVGVLKDLLSSISLVK